MHRGHFFCTGCHFFCTGFIFFAQGSFFLHRVHFFCTGCHFFCTGFIFFAQGSFFLHTVSFFLRTTVVGLCVLAASICSVLAATCPSSMPTSAATTTEQYTFDSHFVNLKLQFILSSILRSFTGYSSIQAYGIVVGRVSNSLYYLYSLQSKKEESDFSLDIMDIQYAQNKGIIKTNNQPQSLLIVQNLTN